MDRPATSDAHAYGLADHHLAAPSDAPSAPKSGAVVRPTRRRVPGAGRFPDRLETSSAARALRAAARARRRRTASCRSRRAAGRGGDGLEGDRLGLDADRGWRGRRPGPPPPKSRFPVSIAGGPPGAGRDSGPSVPGRARLTGEAAQAATRARFHDACAARPAAMADAPSAPACFRVRAKITSWKWL